MSWLSEPPSRGSYEGCCRSLRASRMRSIAEVSRFGQTLWLKQYHGGIKEMVAMVPVMAQSSRSSLLIEGMWPGTWVEYLDFLRLETIQKIGEK